MSNTTFVRLFDSSLVRRNILKSALDSTRLLKYHTRYKTLKKEKSKRINELKGILENIDELMIDLNKKIPDVKENKKEIKVASKKRKISKQESYHPSKLDKELRDIEEKLNNLNF